jgi:hypothetical protein
LDYHIDVGAKHFFIRSGNMEEIIFPLTLASVAAGLIVAGISIAKGSKTYAYKEDVSNDIKRIDGEFKEVWGELSQKASLAVLDKLEKKVDRVGDKVDDNTKAFIALSASISEWRKLKE